MPTSILSPNTLIAFQVLCCTRVEAFRSTLRRYNLCNPVCSILSLLMLFKETVAAGERRWVKECSIYRLVGPHITRLLCRWQILKRFFLSSLTHISHLLLLPSVLFNLFTTHWLQIGTCSKHNPPQIPTLSSVLFLPHVQCGCCFHCKDEDFQELEDGLGEGALEKAEHRPPESRSHGSGLELQNISSSYCFHRVNMHNMNITKAMITTKSTFPVYVFSKSQLHSQWTHMCLFIYLFFIIVEVLLVLVGGNVVHVWHISSQ